MAGFSRTPSTLLAVLITGAVLTVPQAQAERDRSPSLVDPATPAHVQAAGAAEGTLVFSDEFNGDAVDTSKWTLGDGERTPHSGIRWWYKPENVGTDGKGALAIKISQLGNNQFAGGSIASEGKFDFTHGTIEWRMHVPKPVGHLGAAWVMPTEEGSEIGTGADGAEIDVLENAYNAAKYPATIHYDGYGEDHQSSSAEVSAPGLYGEWYHTYGLEWSPDKLTFLYDGKPVREVTDPKLISQVASYPLVSHEILQFAEGDIHNAPFDETSNVYADYIRVWQG